MAFQLDLSPLGTVTRWETAARYYEAFEICEYGTQPSEARVRQLFPMLR